MINILKDTVAVKTLVNLDSCVSELSFGIHTVGLNFGIHTVGMCKLFKL